MITNQNANPKDFKPFTGSSLLFLDEGTIVPKEKFRAGDSHFIQPTLSHEYQAQHGKLMRLLRKSGHVAS